MIRFPRQITSEFFEYTYAGSITDIKEQLEELEKRSRGFYISPNLLVKLKPGNEFTVINKYELGTYKSNPFHTSTSLKGYYVKTGPNSTQVNLLVTPHSIFPMLFLLLPVFFIFILFTDVPDTQKFTGFYPVTILMMIAVWVALLLISAFSKKRLLNRFVKHINITPIS